MKYFLLLLITSFTYPLLAQTIIKGKIVGEKNEAIVGANIYLKDTYDGSSSEADGTYSFETSETGEQTLVVSYIGYKPYEESVNLSSENIEFDISIIEEANELNTVVISAGSFEASDEKKAVILSSLDIVTTAGATADVAGALNTLPGTQRVGEDGQLFVRGGAAYETKTFIDGLYISKPYNSTAPDVPARGRFSPFLFKGTMFSTGGYSAEYGQALSSALILESQDLAASTTTGISLMSIGLSGSHTQRWEKTSLAATGSYTNLAPYLKISDQDLNWKNPPQGANGQIIFRHKIAETGIFKMHAEGSRRWFSLRYPDLDDLSQKKLLDLTNDNYYANASFREILGEKWTLFAGASYGYNHDKVDEKFHVKTDEHTGVAKVTLTNNLTDGLKIKFGGEYLKSDFNEEYIDPDQNEFKTHLKEDMGSAFAEMDVYLSKKFVVRLGNRLEYSNIIKDWNLASRLSIAYKTTDHAQVSFAYGNFYQTPINDQLRYTREIKFEEAKHLILNYQYIKGTRTFRVEGYYKFYENLVKFDAETPWLANNSGDGHARGIDVFFRDKGGLLKKADFWISYSFLDTERNWRDYPFAAPPRFASKHNLSVVFKQWFPKITSNLGVTYSLGSPRPYTDPNTDGFNDQRTPMYHNLSMNFSHLTHLFGHFTVLHLSINNLPGFDNTFGYRYSNTPDANGQYTSYAIKPAINQFIFVGCFISIGQKYSSDDGITPN